MSDLRKAAEAVLERWDSPAWEWIKQGPTAELMAALRASLAASEPEPVAYFDPQKREFYWARPTQIDAPTTVDVPPLPLYAAPPPAAPSEDIEALRRDAERYRWMKREVKRIPPAWDLVGWDAAIDAAMQEDKP